MTISIPMDLSGWADPFGLPPAISNKILGRQQRAKAQLAERRKARETNPLPAPSRVPGQRPSWVDSLPIPGEASPSGRAPARSVTPGGMLNWPLAPSPLPAPRARCLSAEPRCLVAPMRSPPPRRSKASAQVQHDPLCDKYERVCCRLLQHLCGPFQCRSEHRLASRPLSVPKT